MATRSVISKIDKKVSNGEITAVYCHSDGYLNWNGKILNEHYTNGNKVDELLSNGGISVLNENIGKPGLDFSDYKKFHSLKQSRFYHRDRGEELKIQTWNGGLNSFVEEAKIVTMLNLFICLRKLKMEKVYGMFMMFMEMKMVGLN